MRMIAVDLMLVVACAGSACADGCGPGVSPVDLRCEYRKNPVGIDAVKPGLSWKIVFKAEGGNLRPERGIRQTAYQVLVATSESRLKEGKADLWDSGKVESDQSTQIEYAGKPLESRMNCHWKVRVWTVSALPPEPRPRDPSPWSEPASWTMGLLKPEDWKGKWIQPDYSRELATNGMEAARHSGGRNIPHELRTGLLRKSFDLPAVPERATVSLNIAGYAELYINGRKVGNDVLTPAVSDHNLQTFIVSHEVTSFLAKGHNVIGVWLGRGWAHGAPAVRLQLDATVAGQAFVLGTGADWKGTASHREWIGGRHWNDFGGERVDARREIPLWNEASVDDSKWPNVLEVGGPKGAAVAQVAPLNRIGASIPAVSVKDIGSGRCEIDFGTCLTGWLRLKMPKLSPGAVVRMTFADVNRNGNYQNFSQRSEFISAGKDGEVFEHKFNYAGFRYVVVEGLPAPPAKEDAVAMLVESDLETIGSFECSDDLLNRIHRLTQWTQRCLNLGGYYVDCPHRERLGYGDGQVAAEGFMTSYRANGFYRKWLCDWRLRQDGNGRLPHVAPVSQGGGGPGWPGLLSAIAWRHYLYYGDKRVLEENYDAVRRYVDYLESLCKDNVMRAYGGKWDFIGDWVAPDRGMDSGRPPSKQAAELFNNCYRVHQMEVLAKMATALGRSDDAARYREMQARIRPAIHAAFYDAAGKQYVIDEQSYYVMPLMTGVTPEAERPAVFANLEKNIMEKKKGHLDTGMLGTYFMMEYLRETGRNDLVFTMFSQTNYPGWGHMLAQGATTCWEQWNDHWSRIHSCFTGADNWLYQGPGGIRPDPSGPGFKKIIIQPAMAGLKWVKARHVSPHGPIACHWTRDEAKITMDVTLPPNTTATVYVPAKGEADVTESDKPAAKAPGVKFLRMEKDAAVFEVGSGVYRFQSGSTEVGKR